MMKFRVNAVRRYIHIEDGICTEILQNNGSGRTGVGIFGKRRKLILVNFQRSEKFCLLVTFVTSMFYRLYLRID